MVPLGINMQGYERRAAGDSNRGFRIGYFARIAPEKGLHVLAEAYVRFRRGMNRMGARLEVAGYAAPMYGAYLETVKRVLKQAGLEGEFTYHGVVDREGKLAFLRSLDVLSVPATYDEPKGMFLLEAMACGVPVVQPRRGAFTEVVEKTSGGLLVTPDDPDALAEAFHQLCNDPAAAAALGENGFQNARKHYSIEVSASRLLEVYVAVTARHGSML
jgi:glycosyltransferase involved in cell wall biosynthesis